MVQPPGQHLLDSFMQVTPELAGIFEAPALPLPGTRRRPNGRITWSPESYGRALGNLDPSGRARRAEEGSTKNRVSAGRFAPEPCVPRGCAGG